MDKQLQQEDTVSADRKERIIFDPDAWRKSDKSGRKTSAITSRQNFDNEKFTRKIKPEDAEKVDEAVKTKTDSPQIEFVSGTVEPKSQKDDSQPRTGVKKIAEDLVKKAVKNAKDETVPFDGPYTKTPDVVVDKSGARHTAYSRVRSLARQALAKQTGVKEEVQIDEKAPEGFEGTVKAMKKHKEIDNPFALANWMKKKGYKSHVKEEAEQIDEIRRDDAYTRDYKSSISGMGKHQSAAYHADGGANDEGWGNERHSHSSSPMSRPHTVHINGKPWKKFDNGHQAHAAARTLRSKGKDAVAIAHFKEEKETDMSKTYAQFMEQLLEYTPGPGGVTRVQGRSYGAQYHDPEGDDDADDKPKAPAAPAVKRGRGRPAGSKSGANQKVTTGKSYGGIATHSLNLPNSNR